jgi:hypothetical protein
MLHVANSKVIAASTEKHYYYVACISVTCYIILLSVYLYNTHMQTYAHTELC